MEFAALGMKKKRATMNELFTFVRRYCPTDVLSNEDVTQKFYVNGKSDNWLAILGGPKPK